MSYLKKLFASHSTELQVKATTDTQNSPFYQDLHLEIKSGGRSNNTKSTTNVMPSILKQQQRMQSTFHSSYVILRLAPSTVHGFSGLSSAVCVKATLLLGQSNRCTISGTKELVDRFEISISQVDFFFIVSPTRLIPDLSKSNKL